MIEKIKKFMNKPLFTGAYIIGLFVVCFYYIYDKRHDFSGLLDQAMPEFLLLAFFIYLFNYFLGILLSQKIYQILGVRITYPEMLKIFSISRIGRYMPGKVWFVSNYYLFSRKLGIDSERIIKNFIIMNALSLITAIICSIPAIFSFSLPFPVSKISLLFFALILLCIIHPKIINAAFKYATRLLIKIKGQNQFDKEEYSSEVPVRYLTFLAGGFLISWLFSGLTLYFMLSAFYPVPFENYPVYLTASVLSKVIGLMAFFAPGGIGVRESIGVLILSPVVAFNAAMMAMVSLRMIQVVSDMTFGMLSFFSLRILDALKERFSVFMIFIKLAIIRIVLFFKEIKDAFPAQSEHGSRCRDNEEFFFEYLKKNLRNIWNLSEGSGLKEVKCDTFNNTYAHDTYLIEITAEDPVQGIIKKKLVAKHFGLRGMYVRTKVNFIVYGRQALKIRRSFYPQIVMKAEIEAERRLKNNQFNVPAIVHYDFRHKYIFTEFIDGTGVDKLVNDIFYNKEKIDRSDISLFEDMGRMLADLHNRCEIIHGEPAPNNWIYNHESGKVSLIDWESVSKKGDPAFDIAHLIYTVGAYARGLIDSNVYLYDEIVKTILRGYDKSFTVNENVSRAATYWDNWILITPLHIQERTFHILNVTYPAGFLLFKKISIPVLNKQLFHISKLSLTYRFAELILFIYRIWFLLIGKSARRYEAK